MELIQSRQNPKIKLLRSLKTRKGRRTTGLFMVEGVRPTAAALESDAKIELICYAPEILQSDFGMGIVAKAKAAGMPCYPVVPQVFGSLSEKTGPQGLAAAVHQNAYELSTLVSTEYPAAVAVVTPQDPGNLGAIVRTMDSVRVPLLILIDGGVDIWHPTAVRASMGAIFWTKIAYANSESFFRWARVAPHQVFGSSAAAGQDFETVQGEIPMVLVLGSEREGLSSTFRSQCHTLVRIPMRGHGTSLNLAVAAGILISRLFPSSK